MPKTNLNNILKNGKNFELQEFNSEKFNTRIRWVLEYKKIIRERKRYDPKLDYLYFKENQYN